MTTLITENYSNTLLDHQWIHTDQAVEYLKAIKERNENQLRDFCRIIQIFSLKIDFYSFSFVIQSSTLSWFSSKTISL